MRQERQARRAVLDEFEQARGDAQDRQWAERAFSRLSYADVQPSVQREITSTALEVIRASNQPAHALLGPAEWWAAARIAERVAQGRPTFAPMPVMAWRDLPVNALTIAAVLYVVVWTQSLFEWSAAAGGDVVRAFGPAVLALALAAAEPAFDTVVQRARLLMAWASSLGTLVLGFAVVFALHRGLPADSFAGFSPRWSLVAAAGCAVLAAVLWLVLRRTRPQGSAETESADDDWLRRFARALRLRVEIPERRVLELVTQVSVHDRRPGASLHEALGDPDGYAERFSVDQRTAKRRRLAIITALVIIGVPALYGVSYVQTRWEQWGWFTAVFIMTMAMGLGRSARLLSLAQRRRSVHGGI